MSVVSLEQVTQRHADRVVLDGVTVGLADGERAGLIGRNGSGKTTLLDIIAGRRQPDSGRVVVATRARVRYLPQTPTFPADQTPLGAVLATPAGFDPLADRADVQREQRARALLDQLGVVDVEAPIAGRSGGQRKRIAIAATLVEDCELLILDEPTNHLDVDVIEWLEGRLTSWSRALLMVTHDRYLLDRVCTRILELHDAALHEHAGTYGSYLEARARREEQAAATERKLASRARVELAWLRRGPKARTSKAKYRVQQAQDVVAASQAKRGADELAIDLPSRRLGGKVVNLHSAGKSFDGRSVLRDVDYKLAPDDRIGIVGPNGSGKTTLLNLIAGRLEPDVGSVRFGDTVHPGFYGQDAEPLPATQRVFDAVHEVVRETELTSGVRVTASQLLERFGFDDRAQRQHVGELSGGERRRLELLRVLGRAPNLLLLDEPTNDLDLDTLAVLEDYLDAWPGALVVATHDRFFLDRVCEHLFSIEPDGALRHHPGGWSAYRERERERRQASRRAPAPRGNADARQRAPDAGRRKRSYHEQRELQALDRRIPALEQRRSELTAQLQAIGEDYARAAAIAEDLSAVVEELETAEQRWLDLSMIGEEA